VSESNWEFKTKLTVTFLSHYDAYHRSFLQIELKLQRRFAAHYYRGLGKGQRNGAHGE
jgi:hypothetical protein